MPIDCNSGHCRNATGDLDQNDHDERAELQNYAKGTEPQNYRTAQQRGTI